MREPTEQEITELHAYARDLVKFDPRTPDKKLLRYNDFVKVGIFYGQLGEDYNQELAKSGVKEAVETIYPGLFYYKGGSCLTFIQEWMRNK